jgi:hypothetical protein
VGTIFTLDSDTKSVIQDALDDLITEFGKDCRLVYPARMVACSNCVTSPIGGMPSNRWKTGGPLFFPAGSTCPLCNGNGRRAEEQSEVLHLLCAYDSKGFAYPVSGVNLRVPSSKLRTKCMLVDAPKLLRCDHLIFDIAAEGVNRLKFKLASNPVDESNIIQRRYATAYWAEIA